MGRKNPDTSIAAYRQLDISKVAIIKSKIIEALKILGKASSEQLADYLGLPYDICWRRCSDLKNDKKIFASDYKVLTKKNRFARQWIICDGSQPKTDKEAKVLAGPSLVHYSRKINAIAKNEPLQLF